MTRPWPPPHDWFLTETLHDPLASDELTVLPNGRVVGAVAIGGQLALRLLEPGVVEQWAVDEVRTAEGHHLRVGTIDVKDWVDDVLTDVGVVAVVRIGYFAPDRVAVVGAVIPDAEDGAVGELAAGRVAVSIEPLFSKDDRPVLAGLSVHRPPVTADPIGPPPVRRRWT